MSRLKHSAEDVSGAVAAYRSGRSGRDVCRDYRVSWGLLRRWLVGAGVVVGGVGRRRKEIDRSRVDVLLGRGLSVRGLARELGVSAGTVWRRAEEWGLV